MRPVSKRTRTRTALFASAMVGALVLAGCGGGGASGGNGEEDPDATLRVMYSMAASLDPVDAPEPAQLTIATWPVYETLLQVDEDAELAPMLATDWEFSEDGETLSLELRSDVTFSDGEPFDAAAVKANLEHYMAAEGSAVQGAVAPVASVEEVGEFEVDIQLEEPTTEILSVLASNLGGIMISPAALDNDDLASNPVGTGAYTIESFQPSQEAVYVRREDEGGIWDPDTGNVARVEISAITSPDARDNALRSGQVDLVSSTGDTSAFGNQVETGELQVTDLAAPNLVGMYFNTDVEPLGDPLVRQAINHAINREEIVGAFAPLNEPRVQPWPDALPGADPSREEQYDYDPDRARELLDEAGHADGFAIPGNFLVATASDIDRIAEAVQGDLSAVGIDITLRTVDILSQVTEYAQDESNPGQFMYMSLPSVDAHAWLQRLFVNPIWTPAGPTPEMLDLIEGTDDPTLSDEERDAQVAEAIDYATDNALYAPLFQGVGGVIATDQVQGLDELHGQNGGVANLRNLSMTG